MHEIEVLDYYDIYIKMFNNKPPQLPVLDCYNVT